MQTSAVDQVKVNQGDILHSCRHPFQVQDPGQNLPIANVSPPLRYSRQLPSLAAGQHLWLWSGLLSGLNGLPGHTEVAVPIPKCVENLLPVIHHS